MTYAEELSKLSRDDFFTRIDRDMRDADLEFAEVCTKRSDEELVDTLNYWKDREGRFAASRAAIVKAEINDRIHGKI